MLKHSFKPISLFLLSFCSMSFGKYGRERHLDDLQPSILPLEGVHSIPNSLLLKKELSVQLGLYGKEFISHFAKYSFILMTVSIMILVTLLIVSFLSIVLYSFLCSSLPFSLSYIIKPLDAYDNDTFVNFKIEI